jgi:hypothetical protein
MAEKCKSAAFPESRLSDQAGGALIVAVSLAPPAGAHPEPAGEHQIEEAERLVTAVQGDVDDFGFGCGQQLTGSLEPEFGTFFPKRHARHLAKNPAEMAWSATSHPHQLVKAQMQQLGGRRLIQELAQPFLSVFGIPNGSAPGRCLVYFFSNALGKELEETQPERQSLPALAGSQLPPFHCQRASGIKYLRQEFFHRGHLLENVLFTQGNDSGQPLRLNVERPQ